MLSRGEAFAKSILFRAKIFPKLPATTSGISFARSAVAACSLEDPYVIEVRVCSLQDGRIYYTAEIISSDKYVVWLCNAVEFGIIVLHAGACHSLLRDMILIC